MTNGMAFTRGPAGRFESLRCPVTRGHASMPWADSGSSTRHSPEPVPGATSLWRATTSVQTGSPGSATRELERRARDSQRSPEEGRCPHPAHSRPAAEAAGTHTSCTVTRSKPGTGRLCHLPASPLRQAAAGDAGRRGVTTSHGRWLPGVTVWPSSSPMHVHTHTYTHSPAHLCACATHVRTHSRLHVCTHTPQARGPGQGGGQWVPGEAALRTKRPRHVKDQQRGARRPSASGGVHRVGRCGPWNGGRTTGEAQPNRTHPGRANRRSLSAALRGGGRTPEATSPSVSHFPSCQSVCPQFCPGPAPGKSGVPSLEGRGIGESGSRTGSRVPVTRDA